MLLYKLYSVSKDIHLVFLPGGPHVHGGVRGQLHLFEGMMSEGMMSEGGDTRRDGARRNDFRRSDVIRRG